MIDLYKLQPHHVRMVSHLPIYSVFKHHVKVGGCALQNTILPFILISSYLIRIATPDEYVRYKVVRYCVIAPSC